jgi:hypothetical protein
VLNDDLFRITGRIILHLEGTTEATRLIYTSAAILAFFETVAIRLLDVNSVPALRAD